MLHKTPMHSTIAHVCACIASTRQSDIRIEMDSRGGAGGSCVLPPTPPLGPPVGSLPAGGAIPPPASGAWPPLGVAAAPVMGLLGLPAGTGVTASFGGLSAAGALGGAGGGCLGGSLAAPPAHTRRTFLSHWILSNTSYSVDSH